jgi:hypothetical protein
MKLTSDRLSPGDTIRKALEYALQNNCRLIAIESNAYQYSLLFWFDFICKQIGLQGIECVPIYSGSRNKNARILEMFKSYQAGDLYVHTDCRLQVHSQIIDFNPMRRDNSDDILDLLAYAPRVVDEYGEYVVANTIIEQQDFDEDLVIEYNSAF